MKLRDLINEVSANWTPTEGSFNQPPPPNQMFGFYPHENQKAPMALYMKDTEPERLGKIFGNIQKYMEYVPGLIPRDEGPVIGPGPNKPDVAGRYHHEGQLIGLDRGLKYGAPESTANTLLHELYHRAQYRGELPDPLWPFQYAQATYDARQVPWWNQRSYEWIPHELAARDIENIVHMTMHGQKEYPDPLAYYAGSESDPKPPTAQDRKIRKLLRKHLRDLKRAAPND